MSGSSFDIKLGHFLRDLRTRCGRSQSDVAVDLSLTSGSVSRLESGETKVSVETLMRFLVSVGADPLETFAAVQDLHNMSTKGTLWNHHADSE